MHTTEYQENKQPNLKIGRRPEYRFFQRRQTHGQQAHEKIFTIINHQGNANQNQNDMSNRG